MIIDRILTEWSLYSSYWVYDDNIVHVPEIRTGTSSLKAASGPLSIRILWTTRRCSCCTSSHCLTVEHRWPAAEWGQKPVHHQPFWRACYVTMTRPNPYDYCLLIRVVLNDKWLQIASIKTSHRKQEMQKTEIVWKQRPSENDMRPGYFPVTQYLHL